MTGSSAFVGRARELSGLWSALAGDTRLLLVVGDAGVGKTRFVSEGLRLAPEGLRRPPGGAPVPIWGACLPLAEKLPFLPVMEALDALGRLDDGALLDSALAAAPQYARAEAGRLLPRLQSADPGGGRPRGWQRGRMFAGVAELLAAAARPAGLVVVVEDVQWADSATLDFLTFLARSGPAGLITVVATCRSDEVLLEPHVTQWLAHLRGSRQVEEIRLSPLSREEAAEQVAALMGAPPPAGVADELYARGEGNPFFTEQLVADVLARPAGMGPARAAGLPARLAELLATRASGCGDAARVALAALAVAGLPLTEEQLREVSGLSLAALHEAVRELAAAQLLAEASADRRYGTRHALLAEAVAAGLLPGERRVLHERTARALEASGGDVLAAEAADHWAAAGDAAEELRARVAAAVAAERVFGYAEAAAHWQRAIELSAAGTEAGMSLPEMYVRASDALYVAGSTESAGMLAEEAYRRFADDPDPLTAAVVHERAGRLRGLSDVFLGGQSAPGSGLPLVTRALELFAQAPPSAEYAEALFYYGHYLFTGKGRYEAGLDAVNLGFDIARTTGASALIPRMLPIPAYHHFLCGQMAEGFTVLRRGRALAESAWDGEAVILIDVYESDALLKTARFEDAAGVALRGLRTARQSGLDAFWTTSILAANAAEALIHQGRTDDAAVLIEPLTDGPPDRDHWLIHVYRSELDLLRGDIAAATLRQEQIAAVIGEVSNVDWSRESAQRMAELQLWAAQPDRALAEVQRVISKVESAGWAIFCGHSLATGMRAWADLAERARARRDGAAARAAVAAGDELAATAAHLPADPFASHPFSAAIPAERATWTAERTRLAGTSDPDAWRAAAQEWERLRWPHRAGYAWWRCAEAALNAGERPGAARALQVGAGLACSHAPLRAEIEKLALRARIPLRAAPAAATRTAKVPAHAGLTSRELTVLRLLAAGRTNAQIGAELFISPKTASVHVTSILRKLGVTGRVQAAAAAERAGLLGDEQA